MLLRFTCNIMLCSRTVTDLIMQMWQDCAAKDVPAPIC